MPSPARWPSARATCVGLRHPSALALVRETAIRAVPMTPIKYTANVMVRFADLDPYGHVNATNYLDYVVTARWSFAHERFGVTDKTFVEKNLGFYMTRADQSFKRPIAGVQTVVASSFVREVAQAKLVVPYDISSTDGKVRFSEGVLEFMCIDLSTNKPTSMPDWVRPFFFEDGDGT